MYKALGGLALAALLAAPVHAQDWRTMTSTRQSTGEKMLLVDLEFGVGNLKISPGAAGSLYRTNLRYDADSYSPKVSYSNGTLKVGTDDVRNVRHKHRDGGRLDLALSPEVPLALHLKFAATESEIELGGLKLRSADIKTGASESVIRISKPNSERCSLFRVHVGAAELEIIGIGNTNAERLEVTGGAGEILLDFGGEWRGRNMAAEINIGAGELTLRVPRSLGVQLVKSSMLVSFETDDMNKQGNTYTSSNWNSATQKLTIQLNAAFGSVNVEWL